MKYDPILAEYENWVLFRGITGTWIENREKGCSSSRTLTKKEVEQILADPSLMREMVEGGKVA